MNELHALVIPAEKFCFCLSLSAGRSAHRVSYRKTPQELIRLLSKGQWSRLDHCQHVELDPGLILLKVGPYNHEIVRPSPSYI